MRDDEKKDFEKKYGLENKGIPAFVSEETKLLVERTNSLCKAVVEDGEYFMRTHKGTYPGVAIFYSEDGSQSIIGDDGEFHKIG